MWAGWPLKAAGAPAHARGAAVAGACCSAAVTQCMLDCPPTTSYDTRRFSLQLVPSKSGNPWWPGVGEVLRHLPLFGVCWFDIQLQQPSNPRSTSKAPMRSHRGPHHPSCPTTQLLPPLLLLQLLLSAAAAAQTPPAPAPAGAIGFGLPSSLPVSVLEDTPCDPNSKVTQISLHMSYTDADVFCTTRCA